MMILLSRSESRLSTIDLIVQPCVDLLVRLFLVLRHDDIVYHRCTFLSFPQLPPGDGGAWSTFVNPSHNTLTPSN